MEDDDVIELINPDFEARARQEIEKAFASATPATVRQVTKTISRLLRDLTDPQERARYESALDVLPEMVKHGVGRDADN